MKNLADLLNLILAVELANEGMAVKFYVSIDLERKWVSLSGAAQNNEGEFERVENKRDFFSHISIETPEKLQEVYWRIYNSARHDLTV